VPLPEPLQAWLTARGPLPPHVAYLAQRYVDEPFRLVIALLASELEDASRDDMTARLLESTPHQARVRPDDFIQPLAEVAQAIPPILAAGELQEVRRQFDIFGLHAARLDLREDSARLAAALGELLRALNLDLAFESGDDAARLAVLLRLLEAPAPKLSAHPGVTAETAETWDVFRLMARVGSVYGPSCSGRLSSP
jgi:phosphoenolpyruvate carboxylase